MRRWRGSGVGRLYGERELVRGGRAVCCSGWRVQMDVPEGDGRRATLGVGGVKLIAGLLWWPRGERSGGGDKMRASSFARGASVYNGHGSRQTDGQQQ
jgi:hypothetical protein